MHKYILALDQGTTSSRAIAFRHDGTIAAIAQQEFPQLYPSPGAVEHDPEAIWSSQLRCARQTLQDGGIRPEEVAAIGVTNQRETTVLWDRHSGEPVANAMVWQSRQSSEICDRLKAEQLEPVFREKTGLVIDAYFSGTKIRWLLDNVPGLQARAEQGDILFGTIDTFLIWRLTKGQCHVTDYSNASRTLIYNIHSLEWDDELLKKLNIPRCMLPEVRPSSEVYGAADAEWLGAAIPIAGDAGDQQAATFGQGCFESGTAKNTYGTGCFLLLNTGTTPVASENGLLTTIAWGIDGQITYGLEGSIFVAGAVVQWLRDELQFIPDAPAIEALAGEVADSGGVYLVPAFVGLGAPHWNQNARGTILGLTRGTNRAHLARAALESMAYQTRDVLDAMQADGSVQLQTLKVDGGASANNLLMQMQADVLNVPVRRPVIQETTALGAAYLAGLSVGFWEDMGDVTNNWKLDREFLPNDSHDMEPRYAIWKRAVQRSLDWQT